MKYMNFDTGEIWTDEEVHKAYELYRDEMKYSSFEEYLEDMLRLGKQKAGGLVEVDEN